MLGTGALGSSFTCCFGVYLLCFFTVDADHRIKEKKSPGGAGSCAGQWPQVGFIFDSL